MTHSLSNQRDAAAVALWVASTSLTMSSVGVSDSIRACSAFRNERAMTAQEAYAALSVILTEKNPTLGLRVFHACGGLSLVIPHIDALISLSQEPGRKHKDVWEHTLAVVEGVPNSLILRLAALLHDIGKPQTFKVIPGKGPTFYNHPIVGASITEESLRDSKVDKSIITDVSWLVSHHLRPAEHSDEWSDSAVRRFVKECGPRSSDLMALSRADLTTRNPAKIRSARRNAEALLTKMERVIAEDAVPQALRKGFGNWLMDHWGLSGRDVGSVKRQIESLVEIGSLPRGEDFSAYEAEVERAVAALNSEIKTCEC